MNSQELYQKMMCAYKAGDENLFNASARNWVEGGDKPNFKDAEANDLFFAAKHHCSLWRGKAINARVSKIRMVDCVRKIAAKNLPNPYVTYREFGIVPQKVKLVDESEAISGWTEKNTDIEEEKTEEVTEHVLGVVPDEKKHLFSRRKKRGSK